MSDDLISSVYFYTYSTIAQTLAGAFGFLVAVVLYLIQGINARIGDCAATLAANSPADRNELRRLLSGARWDEMIRLHAEAGQVNPAISEESNRFTDQQYHDMRREVLRQGNIRRELSRSMFLTGTVILVSIVSMPLTAFFFHPRDPFAVSLLTCTILAAMFCIRGYLRLMFNVFPS
ncbi:MAG: hypothetical protein HY290_31895 [Planctomycetia bacterium]|nr:hypothetical protein [Planctomycetia bacterium]